MNDETGFDALDSLYQWAQALIEEKPYGLGEQLLRYADAWRKERSEYIEQIVKMRNEKN